MKLFKQMQDGVPGFVPIPLNPDPDAPAKAAYAEFCNEAGWTANDMKQSWRDCASASVIAAVPQLVAELHEAKERIKCLQQEKIDSSVSVKQWDTANRELVSEISQLNKEAESLAENVEAIKADARKTIEEVSTTFKAAGDIDKKRIAELEAENTKLRAIIAKVVDELGSGKVSESASVEFMESVPNEVNLVMQKQGRRIAELETALNEAKSLVIRHHGSGFRCVAGCLCPVCSPDGKDEPFNKAFNALNPKVGETMSKPYAEPLTLPLEVANSPEGQLVPSEDELWRLFKNTQNVRSSSFSEWKRLT